MSDYPIDNYNQKQAKELVNLMFDKGFLAHNLSREALQWLEDYVAFYLQSNSDMAVKSAMLVKSLRGLEVEPETEDSNA